MSRRCQHVYGAHLCGRTARLRVGLAVPPHEPKETRDLCYQHANEWKWELAHELDDDGLHLVQVEELPWNRS